MSNDNAQNKNTVASFAAKKEGTILNKILAKKREIMIGVITVVVAIILIAIIKARQESRDLEAWEQMYVASYQARRTQSSEADALLKVKADNKNTRPMFYADMNIYAEAGMALTEQELEKAEYACQDFLNNYPRSMLAGQVRVDYAAILCNRGKYDLALEQYDIVLKSGPDYMKGEALLLKGLCLRELERDEEALDALALLLAEKDKYAGELGEFAIFARYEILNKKNTVVADEQIKNSVPLEPDEDTEEQPKTSGEGGIEVNENQETKVADEE